MPLRSFQHEIPRRVESPAHRGSDGALPDEEERFKFSGFTREFEAPKQVINLTINLNFNKLDYFYKFYKSINIF